jgi:hypothetical protein
MESKSVSSSALKPFVHLTIPSNTLVDAAATNSDSSGQVGENGTNPVILEAE